MCRRLVSAALEKTRRRREDNAARVRSLQRSTVHARVGVRFWVSQGATGTMSGVGEVFLNVVAPVIGLTLANVMFFSGVPAMLRCKREGSLGDMNPGPFPVVLANCVGWMGYSLLIHDYFLFFGNAPASMVGMYFTLVGYGLSAPASETRRLMERLVMGLMGATLAVVFYLGMVAVDTGATAADKRSVMGLFCNFVLLLYYAVPLSTIREVLETRDSRSLFAPMAAANTANGLAWFCYGIALNDAYLMAPNGIGAALGITQLALIRAYPAKRGGAFASGGGGAAPRPPSASASAQDLLRAHDEERAATERGHETRA